MSPVRVNNNFSLSSTPTNQIDNEKQGIVSILRSDCERTKAAAAVSLRRTLSADMSSKKWLAQNGFFCPMKKIASSDELNITAGDHHSSSSSSSEGEEEYEGNDQTARGQDDVWRSIQSQKEKDNELSKQQQHVWSWCSILTQKSNENSSNLPPPYIHPLVKRSTSSLSDKSLEICTESLGSETGSDGFSSYSHSEEGDHMEVKDKDDTYQPQEKQFSVDHFEGYRFAKYNYSVGSRKMDLSRSFPPPLPSLARGGDGGASLHMHSHRENGRLVLEAVSVPSQNYFRAQRQDGRLLLTLVNNNVSSSQSNGEMDSDALVHDYEEVLDDIEEVVGNDDLGEFVEDGYEEFEDEDEEEDEEEFDDEQLENGRKEEMECHVINEHNPKMMMSTGRVIDVHKSALVMKKLIGRLDNKNLTWANPKSVGVDEVATLPQSLPPPPRVSRLIPAVTAAQATATAAATSLNAYEYFWKDKPSMASIIKPISLKECTTLKSSNHDNDNNNNNNNKAIGASSLKGYEQQNLVLMRGVNKADSLVPLLRRCNEPKRSLLLWEPYCIATS